MKREDMHVHSQFSDGRDSVMANATQAHAIGLERLGCVDHVWASTNWLPDYVAAVRDVARRVPITLTVGIEAKILDAHGRLDVPDRRDGVDLIYAADHRVPLGEHCVQPRVVRDALLDGSIAHDDVMRGIVTGTLGAMERYPSVVVAHLFSVLPKIGLSESDIPRPWLVDIARTAAQTGSSVEISERWRCPGSRTLDLLLAYNVDILWSTDAHNSDDIGRYDYVRRQWHECGVLR